MLQVVGKTCGRYPRFPTLLTREKDKERDPLAYAVR
jgi:hypothetical protein